MSLRTEVLMGTLVTIHVVSAGADAAIDRAFGWFREIEERCTRFDERSELMQLGAKIGVPVPASTMLFEAVQFAVKLAEDSGGAFDPTIGRRMETLGFNREHRTGQPVRAAFEPVSDVSYRDVTLDPDRQSITLLRPLTLDLGAVAKGLAIDMAALELKPLTDFAIDAGGDLYLGGCNPDGRPWSVGIRHPRAEHDLIDSVKLSNKAICTSGDYERPAPRNAGSHHLLDPRTGASPTEIASVTVVASSAMVADAVATAVFVMGPAGGLQLLERLGVQGLIVTPDLQRLETASWRQ